MLGCGETGRVLAHTLLAEPELGLTPVVFLDNRVETWNHVVEGVPVLGPLGLAQDFEYRAHAAILALADLGKEDVAASLQDHHPKSLSQQRAVSIAVEGPDFPSPRERVELAEQHVSRRGRRHIRAAD